MIHDAIKRMEARVRRAKEESDVAYFYECLLFGEFVLKMTVVTLLSFIIESKERSRYGIEYRLIRANGIGDWGKELENILGGVASQHLDRRAYDVQSQITKKVDDTQWQHKAVSYVNEAITILSKEINVVDKKTNLLQWFKLFIVLRNKSRGHGATLPTECSRMCVPIHESIQLIIDNLSIYRSEWAYLRRNLAGNYRVTPITDIAPSFTHLKDKINTHPNYEEGVYIHLEGDRHVSLMVSDPDLQDYYLPNGGFVDIKYEVISYITNSTLFVGSDKYQRPPETATKSETEGNDSLYVLNNCLTNIPVLYKEYVERKEKEDELQKALLNQYPIICLIGRGGIGKTSLALKVLSDISSLEQYDIILWLSARDIDLHDGYYKIVEPQVLERKDIAKSVVKLLTPQLGNEKADDYLSDLLAGKKYAGPILLVIDNFETVRDQYGLYYYLQDHVKLPNKILITTRRADYKGQFDVKVEGMSREESDALMRSEGSRYNVVHLLTPSFIESVQKESEGHPYIIKIFLGEVARSGKVRNVEHVVSTKDDLLDALFERTYNRLTPAEIRVYLTLCGWKSDVPRIALEAVVSRHKDDPVDIEKAIDSLILSSLIETKGKEEMNEYLVVPLASFIFGAKKLRVDPYKYVIEDDVEIMRLFGATRYLKTGGDINVKIDKLFNSVAQRIVYHNEDMDKYIEMLDFIGRRQEYAWHKISELYEQAGRENAIEYALRYEYKYLEGNLSRKARINGWRRVALLQRRMGRIYEQAMALVEINQMTETDYDEICGIVDEVNEIVKTNKDSLEVENKDIIFRKLLEVMESRLPEATPKSLSQMSWLSINVKNQAKAKKYCMQGYQMEPDNRYILAIKDRFGW